MPDALEYYEKAFKIKTNNFTTPIYLLKAAETAIAIGENSKALGYLNRIKTEYPKASNMNKVEALIGKATASL